MSDETGSMVARAIAFGQRREVLTRHQSEFSLKRQASELAGQELHPNDAERQLRAEQNALAKERRALLTEIRERYLLLLRRQGELARFRSAIAATRGETALPPMTIAERKLRAQIVSCTGQLCSTRCTSQLTTRLASASGHSRA